MAPDPEDRTRGIRLQDALAARNRSKMMAFAVELGVSAAALSKWKQGGTMSVEHACLIAELLDISLDWFLLGRNTPDWHRAGSLSDIERELLQILRDRPRHIVPHMRMLLLAIPRCENPESGRTT